MRKGRALGSVTRLGPALRVLTLSNSAEGGSDGTTVTTGNSGGASGDAWDVVSIGGGNALTFEDSPVGANAFVYRFNGAAAAQVFTEWDLTLRGGGLTQAWTRFYVYALSTPAAQRRLYRVRGPLPTLATMAFLRVNFTGGGSTRKLELFDATNTVRWTSTANEPLDSWYRVEMYWSPQVSRVWFYSSPDSPSADEDSGDLSFDFGSEVFMYPAWGAAGSTTAFGTMYMDNIGLSTFGKLGPLGTFTPPAAPSRMWPARTLVASQAAKRAVW